MSSSSTNSALSSADPEPDLVSPPVSSSSSRWLSRLATWGAWLVTAALALATLAGLEAQEADINTRAWQAVARADQAERAWNAWDGVSPIPDAQWAWLPSSPRAGVALTRYAFSHRGQESDHFVPRVATLPFLIDAWYRDVPPAELQNGEIALLAFARLPQRQLERAMRPLSVAMGVALEPDLAAEVARRCPGGCAPLSGGDAEGYRRRLLSLLENDDDQVWLAALDVLTWGGPGAVPLLEAWSAANPSPSAAILSFLALQRTLPLEARAAARKAALSGNQPGVRLMAMLEAVRARDGEAVPALKGLEHSAEPPGAGVVAGYASELLEGGGAKEDVVDRPGRGGR